MALGINLRFWVQGSGFWVQGSGFRVQGSKVKKLNGKTCFLFLRREPDSYF
jgi:hypothetical protein